MGRLYALAGHRDVIHSILLPALIILLSTERLFLALQVQEDRDQRNMLYDIGKIAGMEDVAVIHACASQENVVLPGRSVALTQRSAP